MSIRTSLQSPPPILRRDRGGRVFALVLDDFNNSNPHPGPPSSSLSLRTEGRSTGGVGTATPVVRITQCDPCRGDLQSPAMDTGRIDVHTHLLPGIDDGCPSFEDSLLCARTLLAAGYTHAFCTPHIWPTLPKNTIANVRDWTTKLQARLDEAGLPLKLAPGGEINLLWGWPAMKELSREQIVTYASAGKYALFDFWADELPLFFEPAVRHLQAMQITPILAHPERVVALNRGDDRMIERVQEMGVLLQMNTWCLTDPPHAPTRRKAKQWLRDGRYFLFGTDSHNSRSMPTRIEGVGLAEQLVGADAVDQLTRVNPRKLFAAD